MYDKPFVRQTEGNVLIILLILVVMVGALTLAFSSGMRGGTEKIGEDNARLMASDIIQYANTIDTAIKMIQIDGTADEDISFHGDFWGHTDYEHSTAQPDENRVFSPLGGGVNYVKAPKDSNNGSDWVFSAINRVSFGGTQIGDSGYGLTMFLPEVNDTVCRQINKALIDDESIPTETDCFGLTAFTGTYSSGAWLMAPGTFDDLKMGCIQSSTSCGVTGSQAGKNYFYAVLVERD